MTQAYDGEQSEYTLDNMFRLVKADNKEFIAHWVTYRPVNVYWADSFEHQAWELEGLNLAYWLYQGQTRLCGLLLMPHNVGEFFLISPFTDSIAALRVILPILRRWSTQDRPIFARSVLAEQIPYFEELGFKKHDCWQWMMRPTSKVTPNLPESFRWVSPTIDDKENIAHLLHTAFEGGVGEYGQRDYVGFLWSVDNFFASERPSLIQQASSLLLANDGTLAGVCLVGLFSNGHPCINFIAVAPEFQRQGLGQAMINHAISTLHNDYSWLTLRVTVGNPAQILYTKMGFADAPAVHTLILPLS